MIFYHLTTGIDFLFEYLLILGQLFLVFIRVILKWVLMMMVGAKYKYFVAFIVIFPSIFVFCFILSYFSITLPFSSSKNFPYFHFFLGFYEQLLLLLLLLLLYDLHFSICLYIFPPFDSAKGGRRIFSREVYSLYLLGEVNFWNIFSS